MKKVISSTILSLAFALTATAENATTPGNLPVVPTAPALPAKAVDTLHKNHPLTKQEAQNKVKALKDKVSAAKVNDAHKAVFDLKVGCADKWSQAIDSYTSTDVSYARSVNSALRELNSALSLATNNSKHTAHYPAKDVEYARARFNTVKTHGEKLQHDNKIAFDTMIACADDYLKFIESLNGKETNDSKLLKNAMRYLHAAELFSHRDKHVKVAVLVNAPAPAPISVDSKKAAPAA